MQARGTFHQWVLCRFREGGCPSVKGALLRSEGPYHLTKRSLHSSVIGPSVGQKGPSVYERGLSVGQTGPPSFNTRGPSAGHRTICRSEGAPVYQRGPSTYQRGPLSVRLALRWSKILSWSWALCHLSLEDPPSVIGSSVGQREPSVPSEGALCRSEGAFRLTEGTLCRSDYPSVDQKYFLGQRDPPSFNTRRPSRGHGPSVGQRDLPSIRGSHLSVGGVPQSIRGALCRSD